MSTNSILCSGKEKSLLAQINSIISMYREGAGVDKIRVSFAGHSLSGSLAQLTTESVMRDIILQLFLSRV